LTLKEVIIIFKLICLSRIAQSSMGLMAASLLGGATLWYVAEHSGPKTGTAVVHVTEANVVVIVGGVSFQVDEWRSAPLVCELPAGQHRLVMTRGGAELYSEAFSLEGGDEVVLTAWSSASGPRLSAVAGSGSGSRPNPPMR
jgi:hypothetical protein